MIAGQKGQYQQFFWIEFRTGNFDLHKLLRSHKEFFIDKYLAIILFDGRPLTLSSEELSAGWYEKDLVAYSPRLTISSIAQLPHEQDDQWCLFEQPRQLDREPNFVVHYAFSLTDRKEELTEADPTWDRVGIAKNLELHQEQLEQFWEEIKGIDPYIYISNGDRFIFVSKDAQQIETLEKYWR